MQSVSLQMTVRALGLRTSFSEPGLGLCLSKVREGERVERETKGGEEGERDVSTQ